MLAETELVDLPPDKVLEIGLAELKRNRTHSRKPATEIDPTGRRRSLQGDPEGTSDTRNTDRGYGEEPGSDPAIHDRPGSGHDAFEVRAEVKETPQFARATSFASMDTPGPFEKKATEAYYYVTPTESGVAAGTKGGMANRVQLLHHGRRFDSRGLSRPLHAVPAPQRFGRLEE